MTDQDPLEGRLSRWFAQEVRRAERDLAARPATPALRHRRTSMIPALASVALVAVVIAGVALQSRLVQPARPTAVAAPTGDVVKPTTAPPDVGLGDIPAQVDGERVLTVEQALGRAAKATGSEPFLVGGVVLHEPRRCRVDDTFAECPAWFLESPEPGAYSLRATLVVDALDLPLGSVALRVHAADPRAESCRPDSRDACRQALVVEAVVWKPEVVLADGMPVELDGRPVLDAEEALARAGAATAPDSFLVGGVAEHLRSRCVFQDGAHGENLLLGCKLLGIRTGDTTAAITSDRVLFGAGPIVLRVHAGDPRSAECAEARRDECRAAIVADEIVWPRQQIVGIGFPTRINGLDVLTPGEASKLAAQPGPMPDTLVAGIVDRSTIIDCLPPAPELGFDCANLILTGTPGPITRSAAGLVAIRLDAWIPVVDRMVARVHSHDPAAAACPAERRVMCEEAIVVDAIVWVDPSEITGEDIDGRPLSIGATKILRPSEVDRASLELGEQVAIAGWVAACGSDGCGDPLLVDMPMSVGTSLELTSGAAGLSGRALVVVERSATGLHVASVLWTGGDPIARGPLTIRDVLPLFPAHELEQSRFGVSLMACTPSGRVLFATSLDGRETFSAIVIIFPTTEARVEYQTSKTYGTSCFPDAFWAHNVMVQVDLFTGATPEDVAAKAAIQAGMDALAASGG